MMPVQVAWYDSVITFTTAIDVREWLDTNEKIARSLAIFYLELGNGNTEDTTIVQNHHDSSITRKIPTSTPHLCTPFAPDFESPEK